MQRFKFILNPQADRGHMGGITTTLEQLVEGHAHAARGDQVELAWVMTERPRHAADLAQQAADDGYDVVVAVGGDGTVHEIVNGLLRVDADRRPVLGILPVGSGNDFAYNTGVPARLEEATRCLFTECVRTLDVGTITDGKGRTEYWDNTIGIGFSGAVNIAVREIRGLRGFLLYLVGVLQTILFKPPALKAVLKRDESLAEERWVSMVSLCNGPREGGGFPVAPNAKMDDGLITYTIMNRLNRAQMLYFLPIVMNAKHLNHPTYFEEGTVTRFCIEADRAMAIHADGEVFGPWEADIRQIEVAVVPAALHILCCDDLRLD
jgi:YegS/Rv2252/BmrU family lipid kinase